MGSLLARVDQRRAPVAVLLLAPPVLLLLIVGLTPEPTRLIFGADLLRYRQHGLGLLAGLMPYRDFPLEYPPLALVPMTLPLLAAPPGGIDAVAYAWRFALVEGLLASAAGWLLFRATGRSRATLVLWAVLVGLAWVSVALRYDLWPTVCVLVAVLVVRHRPGVAGVALGIGTMLKLYPVVVLVILAAYVLVCRERAGPVPGDGGGLPQPLRRDRYGLVRLAWLVVGWGSVVALVMAAAWVAAGVHSLDWLTYHQDRGLQIESLGAGLLLGLHLLAGHPVDIAYRFGAVEIDSPGSTLLVAASPFASAALLAGVAMVAALRFRREQARQGRVSRESIVLASAAAISALLVTSKVLSVQYVIWLLPLVPFLRRRMRWLALAIVALSTAIFTTDYAAVWRLEAWAIVALLLRNALLVVFAGWTAVELARGRPAEE